MQLSRLSSVFEPAVSAGFELLGICFQKSEKPLQQSYLNSNVEAGDIEGLEHDLCCVLSVFWCVEGRFCLKREDRRF